MTNASEVQTILTQTQGLIQGREVAAQNLAILQGSADSPEADAMWIRLLPSRITAAQKRLDEFDEEIDFNLAYCAMRLAEIDAEIALAMDDQE